MFEPNGPVAPAPAIVDEQVLVARLKAGDAEAYEVLVRTHGARLLGLARRFLRDDDAAADAVQDAFVNAFRAMARFDGHSQLGTWLHRIVVNSCLMRLRSRQRRPEQSIELLLPAFADDGHHAEPVVSWADSAERQLEREDTRRLVRAAIAQLPPSYRAVILMRDMEGLSTAEAAAAVGVSENALKLRLHRARQALATILRAALQPRPAHPGGRVSGTRPRRPHGLFTEPLATMRDRSAASSSHHAAL